MTVSEVGAVAGLVCADVDPVSLAAVGVPDLADHPDVVWAALQSLVVRGLGESAHDGTVRVDARVGFLVRVLAQPERSVAVVALDNADGAGARFVEGEDILLRVSGRPPGILTIVRVLDHSSPVALAPAVATEVEMLRSSVGDDVRIGIVIDVESGKAADRGVVLRQEGDGSRWSIELSRDLDPKGVEPPFLLAPLLEELLPATAGTSGHGGLRVDRPTSVR